MADESAGVLFKDGTEPSYLFWRIITEFVDFGLGQVARRCEILGGRHSASWLINSFTTSRSTPS